MSTRSRQSTPPKYRPTLAKSGRRTGMGSRVALIALVVVLVIAAASVGLYFGGVL